MAVRIVAKYDNPTLLESFTAPVITLGGLQTITDSELNYQCGCLSVECDPETLWQCPGYPAPNEWCYPGLGTTESGCLLVAYYTLPTLLRGGVWELTIELSLSASGTPPDPFDPSSECYYDTYWGCNGSGFATPLGGDTPTWPIGADYAPEQIDFIEGATGLCASSDTFLSKTFEVGIFDNRYVCACGEQGLPEISFGRGGGISDYDVSISGVWVSDFPP